LWIALSTGSPRRRPITFGRPTFSDRIEAMVRAYEGPASHPIGAARGRRGAGGAVAGAAEAA
ncbi:MAG: hypothetical protein AAGC46_00985, partial [Solirubrobacteraceae bacterium]